MTSNYTFTDIIQLKKETINLWEFKVGSNDNIANFVRLLKPRVWHAANNPVYIFLPAAVVSRQCARYMYTNQPNYDISQSKPVAGPETTPTSAWECQPII